jgi:UDP-N-acetylglucosamine 2-epimerase (non-hydrolysing)
MSDVLFVVGARPNFVKVAPVLHALARDGRHTPRVLHTGQHYDHALSGSFMETLEFPAADFHLGVGSGSHAEQTAKVLVGVEQVLQENDVAMIVVPGDVNSTMAAALAAAKLGVPVAHLESGLRSRDWTMPEEINRVVTDRISDLLLCPSADAIENLAAEGIAGDHVALVGNTMIDSLYGLRAAAERTGAVARLGLEPGGYVLVTLHRPALVDDPERLGAVIEVLDELTGELPVVFPVHPRTRARMGDAGFGRLTVLDPLEYLDFVALEMGARLVVTDSGGVQEETTALGVPCITYRTTTERPVTVELGTNRLVKLVPEELRAACREALDTPAAPEPPQVPLWDGRAGERAAEAIAEWLERSAHRDVEAVQR